MLFPYADSQDSFSSSWLLSRPRCARRISRQRLLHCAAGSLRGSADAQRSRDLKSRVLPGTKLSQCAIPCRLTRGPTPSRSIPISEYSPRMAMPCSCVASRRSKASLRCKPCRRRLSSPRQRRKPQRDSLNVAQDLITNPLPTIASVPRGILGFLNQAGQALKNVTEGNDSGLGQGQLVENLSGFAKTKRDLALKLGVDPYCNNQVFQSELNKVAWPAFLGKFAVGLGMGAIGGAAGATIHGLNWTATLQASLRDKSPGGTAPDEPRTCSPTTWASPLTPRTLS